MERQKINELYAQYRKAVGRPNTHQSLARLETVLRSHLRRDAAYYAKKVNLAAELIIDARPGVMENCLEGQLGEQIKKVLQHLSHREREIIIGRYFCNISLEGMGKIFGVSRERIRQIENRALRKMQSLVSCTFREYPLSDESNRKIA